jgi:hypothetical protein
LHDTPPPPLDRQGIGRLQQPVESVFYYFVLGADIQFNDGLGNG